LWAPSAQKTHRREATKTTRPAQAVLTSPRISRKGGWIENWEPEDAAFWDGGGARIARRNLVFSILCEHVGFSVWSLWSVFVLFLIPAYAG
jgi:NNP family nitrate/nitrite transporter-like MFS transporter